MIYYFDTNVYRKLGRILIANGKAGFDSQFNIVKTIENNYNLEIKVSYLVLAEMVAHLNDKIDSVNYIECKQGLYIALLHSDFNEANLFANADSEFINTITGEYPILKTLNEKSLYKFLLDINENNFEDDYISQKKNNIQDIIYFLNDLKKSWSNLFITYIIKKHDKEYTGNWKTFENNQADKTKILNDFRKLKKNNNIYLEFGVGLYEYVNNIIKNQKIEDLNNDLLLKIINRYKPLFDLQYRIIEFLFQSGYNLDKYVNDITDFFIVANLDVTKTVFVSNETKHLVPNLHKLGYENYVWTLDKYCSFLDVDLN